MIWRVAAGRAILCRASPTGILGLLAVLADRPVLLAMGAPAVAQLTETCLHMIRFCFATLVRVDGLLHGAPLALFVAGFTNAAIRRLRRGRSAWRTLRLVPRRQPVQGEVIYEVAARCAPPSPVPACWSNGSSASSARPSRSGCPHRPAARSCGLRPG